MPRKVFYSFDYVRDLQRIHMIGNVPGVQPQAPAGFKNLDKWKEAEAAGEQAIHALVDEALADTDVTVVFLGEKTSERKGISYEIEASLKRGNALLGIQIHHLPNNEGIKDQPGKAPRPLRKSGFRVYKYFDRYKLRDWIDEAEMIGKKIALERERSTGLGGSDSWWADIGEVD